MSAASAAASRKAMGRHHADPGTGYGARPERMKRSSPRVTAAIWAQTAHASDVAQDAARAGATAGGTPRPDGGVVVDERQAREAATAWLAREGFDPSNSQITVAPALVTVTVHQQRPTNLLRLIGISALDVNGDGAARPAVGINKEGT